MDFKNLHTNYDETGENYSGFRRTDPRIASLIHEALGSAKTVLNIGAGSGSYEPDDRYVVPLEPSRVMRSQRRFLNKIPALKGTADSIPFDDKSFDACLALLTVHHWPDIKKGIHEMIRVTSDRIIIMTFDPDDLNIFWNSEYFPELIEVEKARYPKLDFLLNELGGTSRIKTIPIPFDCVDGFQEAYFGRPEAFLDKEIRRAQSAWKFLPSGLEDILVNRLRVELDSGEWDKKYGHFRKEKNFQGALRVIITKPSNSE